MKYQDQQGVEDVRVMAKRGVSSPILTVSRQICPIYQSGNDGGDQFGCTDGRVRVYKRIGADEEFLHPFG